MKEITSEWITVDEGKPTTKIQFRMEDGRKLIQKFNHDHTMSDLFLFVGAQDNFDVPFMVSTFQLSGPSFHCGILFPENRIFNWVECLFVY